MEQTGSSHKAEHLCVLVHGLWGNPAHLTNVAKVLREKHSEDKLHILVAKNNSGSFTYDGIECGGERVCQEIEEELERLKGEGQVIKKLSICGYSLGGLISRYAVGLLYSRGVFDRVEPVNFTTFATPHLGVRTPLRGYHNHLWNVLGARTLSLSGRQLFIIDKFRDTGRSLLSVLADPESIFIKGLAKFERRTLYANIVNDRSAVYYTTGITKTDPFTNLGQIAINYLKDTENVLVDGENPVAPKEPQECSPLWCFRLMADVRDMINRVPFLLAMIVFIPFGTLAFLINAGVQSFASSRRIKLHESGRAGIEVSSYRMPLLLTGMRGAVEDVYENLNSAQSNDYLASEAEEEAISHGDPTASRMEGEEPLLPEVEKSTHHSLSPNLDDTQLSHSRNLGIQTLALAPEQFAMISALDNVGFRKYPVHIHKVNHSHAAMIVRMNKPAFSEGYIVLRHWVENEFSM
ncbi:MAG: hypothetical protein M1818_006431 [Claussenomyces sp. TS43310]|nr:MAG: hypothetical protein M1818_006431 [Claussenomyces sp. TS43310]